MITAVAVLLVVVLPVVPGQVVATIVDATVTAVAWAAPGEPRARAPPRPRPTFPAVLDPAEGPCPYPT